MSNARKLSAFRQLSLTNYDSPPSEQKRKSLIKQFSTEEQHNLQNSTSGRRRFLKKQFSEDIVDKFLDHKIGGKTVDRPHPIKIAWAETELHSPKSENGVIVKKCIKEVKKGPKLTRHSSLEKDSILYSKQELADRLKQAFKEREEEKRNINIFLAQNIKDCGGSNEDENHNEPEPEMEKTAPKIIPPLLNPLENNMKNVFQIRKNRDNISSSNNNNSLKSSAIVVIPIVEKEENNNFNTILNQSTSVTSTIESPLSSERSSLKEDPKAIKNVIIRPSTAAAKREFFKKRTNSAFNSIAKEAPERPRPTLVRSSSAPTRPEQVKPKFLATKRKIKSGKKSAGGGNKLQLSDVSASNKENPKSMKELNRYVPVNGTDVETMVSLISPTASDNEEVEEEKPKTKGSPVKESTVKREEKGAVSLRKTVKSVSFQQSSIHAIRSFSASFPGRRSSMATALMSSNGSALKTSKIQEKRATNSEVPDDHERGPKRRLVRSATEKVLNSSESDLKQISQQASTESTSSEKDLQISIDIKDRKELQQEPSAETADNKNEPSTSCDNALTNNPQDDALNEEKADDEDNDLNFGSAKEKQCWAMYCKMTEKGLKVSYDTILRGMLTPTEYRLRRKENVANTVETNETQQSGIGSEKTLLFDVKRQN